MDSLTVERPTVLPWTYSDGGRNASGREGSAGDCVVRAIAIAAGLAYSDVFEAMRVELPQVRTWCMNGTWHYTRAMINNPDTGNPEMVWTPYLEELGWSRVALDRGTYLDLPAEGRLIVRTVGHLQCVIDGVQQDQADWSTTPTGRPSKVHGYWVHRAGVA